MGLTYVSLKDKMLDRNFRRVQVVYLQKLLKKIIRKDQLGSTPFFKTV